MSQKVAATYHPYRDAEEAALARKRDYYAAMITADYTYTYRHAGPVARRAIDMLMERDNMSTNWERETLALAIQQWSDERYCVPLTTRPPEHSSYSLADHLLATQEPTP